MLYDSLITRKIAPEHHLHELRTSAPLRGAAVLVGPGFSHTLRAAALQVACEEDVVVNPRRPLEHSVAVGALENSFLRSSAMNKAGETSPQDSGKREASFLQ